MNDRAVLIGAAPVSARSTTMERLSSRTPKRDTSARTSGREHLPAMPEEHTDAISRRTLLKGAVAGGAITGTVGLVSAADRRFGLGPDPRLYSEIDVKEAEEREWGVTSLNDPDGLVEEITVKRDVPAEWIEENEGDIQGSLPMPDPESFSVDFRINTDSGALTDSVSAVRPATGSAAADIQIKGPETVRATVPAGTGPWTAEILNFEFTSDAIGEAIATLSRRPLWDTLASFTFDIGVTNE